MSGALLEPGALSGASEAAKNAAKAMHARGAVKGTILFGGYFVMKEAMAPVPVPERVGGVLGASSGIVAGHGAFSLGRALGFGMMVPMIAAGVADLLVYNGVRGMYQKAHEQYVRGQVLMRAATNVGLSTSNVFGTNAEYMMTQRQESIRAIQGSLLNARSSIGNEAAMMRMSVDDYFG
jgi:hypothetical protein